VVPDPRDARIQELEAENARLRQEVQRLTAEVAALRDRLEQLSREAHRQAAPFRRKDQDKKPPDQHNKPGRPAGHPPAHRPRPPSFDDEIEVLLEACPHCHGPVQDLQRREQFIEELPPIRPRVTRLVTYTGTCPQCGEVQSTHPMQVSTAVGAAGTHLGVRAVALAALLNKHLGLTTRTTCRVLKALGGLSITPGGLVQAMHRVADKTQDALADLVAGLRDQPSVHMDETSWWVGGPGWWLWVFTTPERTVFRVEEYRRNPEARADALRLPVRTDPVEERVANRLRKRRQWLFTFLDRPGVEATNNRAERALRPGVIARRRSCGNKTVRGKRTWEILASLAATCNQRGQDFVEFLRPYLVLAPKPATR